MTTYNEQTAMQGISERFAKAADELRLTGRQLYRDEIVANDQVLSKIAIPIVSSRSRISR